MKLYKIIEASDKDAIEIEEAAVVIATVAMIYKTIESHTGWKGLFNTHILLELPENPLWSGTVEVWRSSSVDGSEWCYYCNTIDWENEWAWNTLYAFQEEGSIELTA
jgi:hypothetical protein|tara:strand:+ start:73 stop:393 length:321 start_codon:yes stop_codon:yes gene_type:complete